MCCPFLHCLTSVFMVSRGKYRKLLHGLALRHRKVSLLTSPHPVSSVTPAPIKGTMNPTASPVTTYSHTASNSPSMETDGQPNWTPAQLCMLTVTVAGKWVWIPNQVPISFSVCMRLFFCSYQGYGSMVGWSSVSCGFHVYKHEQWETTFCGLFFTDEQSVKAEVPLDIRLSTTLQCV